MSLKTMKFRKEWKKYQKQKKWKSDENQKKDLAHCDSLDDFSGSGHYPALQPKKSN
jgi:hypothetical protein